MRRFLWLGVFLLSMSWLFFISQFTLPDPLIGFVLLILGILCMILGVSHEKITRINRKILLLLIPLVLSFFIVQFPYNLGIIVLTIGLLFLFLMSRYQRFTPVCLGTSLAGIVLLFQTALFPFYVLFTSHGHRVDILSPLISTLGNILGLHTSVQNGIVFVQSVHQTYPFTTTWEKLGLYPWFNLLLGALILFFIIYRKRKFLVQSALFLIIGSIYLLVRYCTLIFLYLTNEDLSLFWNPLYLTISFLPLALLLIKIFPVTRTQDNYNTLFHFSFNKKQLLACVFCFLFFFTLIGACVYHDPGAVKNGRVLIDECHSDWEDTLRPMNTTWFGLLSTYNYYSWAQFLESYYHVDTNVNTSLTSEVLLDYDILILKCPTESYQNEEIQAIHQFVYNGGGLYLIGDHTNVFGMNTFLNEIAEPLGMRLRTDATYELGTGALSITTPDSTLHHPIMQHVPFFDFMTSCSLEPTSLASSLTLENIIIGDRLISEPGTYATENFFRESVASPDSDFGYLLQSAAMTYGRGRVIIFTDSTVFSSFSFFSDGYSSYTLGVMTYLNRMNSSFPVSLILFVLSIIFFVSFLFLILPMKKITVLWVLLFAGLLAFTSAVPLFTTLNSMNYPLPEPHTDTIMICFDQEYSSANISLKPSYSLYPDQHNFGTFYVWTQRINCTPSLETRLTDALPRADVLVFINPTQAFDETTRTSLSNYVRDGGTILLMDSIANNHSTAQDLAHMFGMDIQKPPYHNESTINISIPVEGFTTSYLSLAGGTPIRLDEHNYTNACVTLPFPEAQGKQGKVVVVVDSYVFSDAVMGGLFIQPDEQQQQLYEAEFYLFEKILLPYIIL